MNKILVLAAHPDDEVLGCGATLSRLSVDTSEIRILYFTDGESSRGTKSSRQIVVRDVCEQFKTNQYHCGNFPDNAMDTVSLLSIVKFIEQNTIYKNYHPDIIFTHQRGCLNIDHQIVHDATVVAFRPIGKYPNKILGYYVPSSSEYNYSSLCNRNSIYYRVSKDDVMNKINIMKKYYASELRKYPHPRSIKNIKNLMRVWGSEVHVPYAEKFTLIREVL